MNYLSHKKKIVLTFVFVLVAMATLIIIAEGFLRLKRRITGREPSVQEIIIMDPKMGIDTPKPNAVFRNTAINSMGFRGKEIVVPKPRSTVRLAFLGGSTTFCANANEENTWPYLVWKTIQEEKPNIQLDYVNAGVPGHTVDESLIMLKHKVKQINPDIIIIYHSTNDLMSDLRQLAIQKGMPSYYLTGKRWILDYSLLWRNFVKMTWLFTNKKIAYFLSKNKVELDFNPEMLSVNFRNRLRTLIKESQKSAKLVVVMTQTYKVRHEQSDEEQLRNSEGMMLYLPFISHFALLKGYEEYNRVIREVANETGALLVEKELDIPGNDDYFADTIHFQGKGNILMAKRVSDALIGSPMLEKIIEK